MTTARLIPLPDGPYEVTGPLEIAGHNGELIEPPASKVYLCRCGRSATKPFCDGSHAPDWMEGGGLSGAARTTTAALAPCLSCHHHISHSGAAAMNAAHHPDMVAH